MFSQIVEYLGNRLFLFPIPIPLVLSSAAFYSIKVCWFGYRIFYYYSRVKLQNRVIAMFYFTAQPKHSQRWMFPLLPGQVFLLRVWFVLIHFYTMFYSVHFLYFTGSFGVILVPYLQLLCNSNVSVLAPLEGSWWLLNEVFLLVVVLGWSFTSELLFMRKSFRNRCKM